MRSGRPDHGGRDGTAHARSPPPLIGIVIGFLGGLLGKGGSAIATPLLHAIGVPAIVAVAAPLPATIPSTLAATWVYWKEHYLDTGIVRTCVAVGRAGDDRRRRRHPLDQRRVPRLAHRRRPRRHRHPPARRAGRPRPAGDADDAGAEVARRCRRPTVGPRRRQRGRRRAAGRCHDRRHTEHADARPRRRDRRRQRRAAGQQRWVPPRPADDHGRQAADPPGAGHLAGGVGGARRSPARSSTPRSGTSTGRSSPCSPPRASR